jgi:hypothetical protein
MKFECDILLKWDRIVMMREPNSDYYWRQIISITRFGALVIPGSRCLIYLMLKIGASILLVDSDYEYLGSRACCGGLGCDSSMKLC